MRKCNLGRIILIALLILNLTVLGCVGYITYEQVGLNSEQTEFISFLENKIDILALHRKTLIEELESVILTSLKLQQKLELRMNYLEKNSLTQLKFIESIINEINKRYDYLLILEDEININKKDVEKLNGYKKKLENKLNSKKDIDLENIKAIKEANVLIKNLTAGCLGSGTHIKIDGEDYVLTCAHLIKGKIEDNLLIIESDFGSQSKAEIVKYNKSKDLMLLKVPPLKNTSYLEISDIAPKEGSAVIVVGNPNGIIDMLTDGIVAKIERTEFFIVTNKVWFGSSGGALIYKNKLVGVLVQIAGLCEVSPFGILSQNFGRTVSLKEIKRFLKEPNYELKSK